MQSSIWTSLAIITWILLLFIGTYFIIRVFPKARNNTCSPMTKAYGINNFSNNNNQDVNPTISALLKSDDETDSTLSNTIIDTVDEVASGGINSADSEGINDNSMHIEKLTHDLLSESDVERVDMNGLVEIGEGQDNEQEILIGIDGIEQ